MSYYISNSGRKIDLEKITIDDISLQDIAHHLTKICRYGGALGFNQHYSVANHCITLFHYAMDHEYSEKVQRNILMHDASECYLGDVVRGLKDLLPDYKEIETRIESLIAEKYNLSDCAITNTIVKDLDSRIILDEAKALFSTNRYKYFRRFGVEPLGVNITCDCVIALQLTKANFLRCCEMVDIYD